MTSRPSGVAAVTMATLSPSRSEVARSTTCSPTLAATAALASRGAYSFGDGGRCGPVGNGEVRTIRKNDLHGPSQR